MSPPAELFELISGEYAQTDESRGLSRLTGSNMREDPNNDGFLGFDKGAGKRILAPFLASSPEEYAAIMKDAMPGISYRYDEKGNIIGKLPDGREALVNPPGFDFTDFALGGAELGKFAPAGRAAALGRTAVQRAGIGVGAAAVTQTGVEGVSAAAGGEFEPSQIAFESAAAAFGSIPDFWRVGKTNIIKPRTARHGAMKEAEALQELSEDPDMTREFRQNVEEFDEAAKALRQFPNGQVHRDYLNSNNS